MADLLTIITDFLTSFFIILALLFFFYGQNWQGWFAGRQIRRSLRKLAKWRAYGKQLITTGINPWRTESMTDNDISNFIDELLEFFIIIPTNLDPPLFEKWHHLLASRENRFHQLIRNFIPSISLMDLSRLTALFNTTIEIDTLYKNVHNNLLVGQKTKSYLYLLSTASEITQTMLTAQAYRIALDSFMLNSPIGDSIGPLAVKAFASELDSPDHLWVPTSISNDKFIVKEGLFDKRHCICIRPKGPECRVGNPGDILESVFKNFETTEKPALMITIDASVRLEVEKTATVAQGVGVALGVTTPLNLYKYQIESLVFKANPSIALEAVVCRISLNEAVSPISDAIRMSIPKILRFLKQILRTQSHSNEIIIILGVGNAIGVE